MINNLSIRWSLRITGFVILGVGLVAVSLLKQRVAVKRVEYKIFDVGLLQVNLFPLFLLYQVFGFFGYAACLFYLPSVYTLYPHTMATNILKSVYSAAIGLSPSDAASIISVFAACNAVGRIVSGLVADRMGNLNVLIGCNFMTGLFCFVIWLFAGTRSVLMVFAALWGFFYGGRQRSQSSRSRNSCMCRLLVPCCTHLCPDCR
jgi:nitrate/nitrite transporter NarK